VDAEFGKMCSDTMRMINADMKKHFWDETLDERNIRVLKQGIADGRWQQPDGSLKVPIEHVGKLRS